MPTKQREKEEDNPGKRARSDLYRSLTRVSSSFSGFYIFVKKSFLFCCPVVFWIFFLLPGSFVQDEAILSAIWCNCPSIRSLQTEKMIKDHRISNQLKLYTARFIPRFSIKAKAQSEFLIPKSIRNCQKELTPDNIVSRPLFVLRIARIFFPLAPFPKRETISSHSSIVGLDIEKVDNATLISKSMVSPVSVCMIWVPCSCEDFKQCGPLASFDGDLTVCA